MTDEQRAEKKRVAAERKAESLEAAKKFPGGYASNHKDRWIQIHCEPGREWFRFDIRMNGNHLMPERAFPDVLWCPVDFSPAEALSLIVALTARYNHWVREMNAKAVGLTLETLAPVNIEEAQ